MNNDVSVRLIVVKYKPTGIVAKGPRRNIVITTLIDNFQMQSNKVDNKLS